MWTVRATILQQCASIYLQLVEYDSTDERDTHASEWSANRTFPPSVGAPVAKRPNSRLSNRNAESWREARYEDLSWRSSFRGFHWQFTREFRGS